MTDGRTRALRCYEAFRKSEWNIDHCLTCRYRCRSVRNAPPPQEKHRPLRQLPSIDVKKRCQHQSSSRREGIHTVHTHCCGVLRTWSWQVLSSAVHFREMANGVPGDRADPAPLCPLRAWVGRGNGQEGSGFSSSAKSSPVSRDALMPLSLPSHPA